MFDYISSTKSNIDYWNLIPQGKITFNLTRNDNKQIYKMIEAFMGAWLMFRPNHICNMKFFDNTFYIVVVQLDPKS